MSASIASVVTEPGGAKAPGLVAGLYPQITAQTKPIAMADRGAIESSANVTAIQASAASDRIRFIFLPARRCRSRH
jgi:hypothetical protein